MDCPDFRTDGPNRRTLDRLYRALNRRRFVHPDPLEFLYGYPDVRDREIAGLLAAALAYGRVTQILRSVRAVLDRLGSHPGRFVRRAGPTALRRAAEGFRHRFTDANHLASLLLAVRRVVRQYGSLNACFVAGLAPGDPTVAQALDRFAAALACEAPFLVPSAGAGSACKRLNLYLRWMVRQDAVDPGGWRGVRRDQLIVPLDTHMRRIGAAWGLTCRKTPDLKMAIEITEAFRRLRPDDPVRYDFVLTRFGIRRELDLAALLRLFGSPARTGG